MDLCPENVVLGDDEKMFCTQCGSQVSENAVFCNQCGVELTKYTDSGENTSDISDKEDILNTIQAAFTANPQLRIIRGHGTDLEMSSILADGNWKVGTKRVEYSACLLADERERTAVFWEMLKESSSGLASLFSFKTESYRTDGKTISGTVKENGYGLNSKVVEYEWNYSRVKHVVEKLVKGKGWR